MKGSSLAMLIVFAPSRSATANVRPSIAAPPVSVAGSTARYLAREFQPGLDERDLRNLQRFQIAVRLCVGGRTEPPFTGITVPPPPSLGDQSAERLVEKTIGRWGRPRAKVEAEIVGRLRSNGLLAAADEELARD